LVWTPVRWRGAGEEMGDGACDAVVEVAFYGGAAWIVSIATWIVSIAARIVSIAARIVSIATWIVSIAARIVSIAAWIVSIAARDGLRCLKSWRRGLKSWRRGLLWNGISSGWLWFEGHGRLLPHRRHDRFRFFRWVWVWA
jgi:hypothetical protein